MTGELFEPEPQAGTPQDGTCSSCGAPIVWIRTAAAKAMPCDPAQLSVVTDAGNVVRGRVSHFATCPSAAQHRAPKREARRVSRRG